MEAPIWLRIPGIGDRGLMAQTAWNNVEDYRAMATVQLLRTKENTFYHALSARDEERINSELDLTTEERIGIEQIANARFTADAHFYLNCWRIIALNIYRIAKAIKSEELKQFLIDQQCPISNKGDSLYFGDAAESLTLGWYAQGRDHFEHIDERIYGGKHWEKLHTDEERIIDLTGRPRPEAVAYFPAPYFDGTCMIVGNSKWEITFSAHNVLLQAVRTVEMFGEKLLSDNI